MEIALASVLLVSMVPAVMIIVRRLSQRARERERYETWAQAAELLGGKPEQVGRRGVFRMTCQHDELDLDLSHAMEAERTTVRCPYAVGVGPRFDAQPRGSLALAQPGMPASLVVEPANVAAPLFNDRRRIGVDAFEYPLEIKSDGRVLTLRWKGVVSTTLLRNAIALAADLASYWRADLERLEDLDGAERESASRLRVREGQAEVTLEVWAEGEPRFVASVPLRGEIEPFSLAIDDPALAEHLPADVAPEPLRARLTGARAEVKDDVLTLTWSRPPTDDAARAAVRLLDDVGQATGARGAFR